VLVSFILKQNKQNHNLRFTHTQRQADKLREKKRILMLVKEQKS